jgi:hypothetical protein
MCWKNTRKKHGFGELEDRRGQGADLLFICPDADPAINKQKNEGKP